MGFRKVRIIAVNVEIHVAGSVSDECIRVGICIIEELSQILGSFSGAICL
jgi:hypothetical protein